MYDNSNYSRNNHSRQKQTTIVCSISLAPEAQVRISQQANKTHYIISCVGQLVTLKRVVAQENSQIGRLRKVNRDFLKAVRTATQTATRKKSIKYNKFTLEYTNLSTCT